ncbi:uncharacterized protein LOC130892041 isoform X1 [Diorhabda carinulata]|uniref:uncharacterized protein LOC130892041 isoform X1 n=1 Tax=Diorhabda carinulata TaxID=1163345 RepID=UPI0025A00156|nr:uncharacterized protein LOC130892041 isoform X1 [Diorhabda carinulata]
MVHRWPTTYDSEVDTLLIVSLVLIGIMIVSQIFYIFYLKYSYKSIKKLIIKKGRLLQLVPVVTLSTVTSTVVDNVPYVLSRECQPTAPPPTQYTDPDISRTYGNKEMPPRYAA